MSIPSGEFSKYDKELTDNLQRRWEEFVHKSGFPFLRNFSNKEDLYGEVDDVSLCCNDLSKGTNRLCDDMFCKCIYVWMLR